MDHEKTISIIIPILNEQENLQELFERLNNTLSLYKLNYEVIAVDDRSSDQSLQFLNYFAQKFPIKIIPKTGKTGRGYSILEGLQYASGRYIATLDADLQYPPEAIPLLLQKAQQGGGVVVADRIKTNLDPKRQKYSHLYQKWIGKKMHGFDVDVRSTLKVFNREIIERINIAPSAWEFDLPLLIEARNAGYPIEGVDIVVDRRKKGVQKFHLYEDGAEIFWSAVKFKMEEPAPVPFHPTQVAKEGYGFHHKGKKFVPHSQLPQHETAFARLSESQSLFLMGLGLVFILLLIINWHLTITVLLGGLTILYFADLLFNLYLIYRSYSSQPEIVITKEDIDEIEEDSWPLYTIFCPLYKEWQVIPQFVTAMSKLDYPKEKLQVMLILEQDDTQTLEKVKEYDLPSYFQTIVVPHSLPKTKPKACNYGLNFARGEYCVIYDAEDVPEPSQLKKAVLAFERSTPDIKCIQAKLNYYNPHQNLLTRVFTAEYSLWFDLVLTGLQSINAPVPLGGTSNHFLVEDLRQVKGWDAFNVTEDCDLGMRLVKQGFRTAIIESTTLEEANSNYGNWLFQRSRWIKGYMQTYLVHMRHPGDFIKNWHDPQVVTFQFVVGGKILSLFINPLMWVITIIYFTQRATTSAFIESFFPTPILYMGTFSLVLGNFLYVYYYMIGCIKREHYDIIKYVFLVPFYWLAMSVAAWIAVYKLITAPHHWSKTKHGLHLNNEKAVNQANGLIGNKLVDGSIKMQPA